MLSRLLDKLVWPTPSFPQVRTPTYTVSPATVEPLPPRILNMQDGDLLVVRYPERLQREAYIRIKEMWHEAMALNGRKPSQVLILDGGADIDVMRKVDAS